MGKLSHTRTRPCGVCGGYESMVRGHGLRCYGFTDGQWCHCTNDGYAGPLQQHPSSQTYAHQLVGRCGCGVQHGRAPIPAPRSARRRDAPPFNKWAYDAAYGYRDERDQLRYQVLRYSTPEKTFRQRRPLVRDPDPRNKDHWSWRLDGLQRLPYRLPELLAVKQRES